MAKLIMHVEGSDGQVDLMDDRVVINRKGLMNIAKYGANAKREIPLGAISEVAFKDASTFAFGAIEFVRSGRSTDEKKIASNSTVRFHKSKQAEFEQLKEQIFAMMNQNTRR